MIRLCLQLLISHPPPDLCSCLLKSIPVCWFPCQVPCTENNSMHGRFADQGSSTLTRDPTKPFYLWMEFFKVEFTNEVIKGDGTGGVWHERGGKRIAAWSMALVWGGRWVGWKYTRSNASIKVPAHSGHHLWHQEWCQGRSLSHWHHGHFKGRVGHGEWWGQSLHWLWVETACYPMCCSTSKLIWKGHVRSKQWTIGFMECVMPICGLTLMVSCLQVGNTVNSPYYLPCKADAHHSSANEDSFQSVKSSECWHVICTFQFDGHPWFFESNCRSHHHRSEWSISYWHHMHSK